MGEGLKIKFRLLENRLTCAWLMFRLDKCGISVDKSSLCDILSGRRKGPKAVEVIERSKVILDGYEAIFG
jgi:hypothetical protein